MPIMADFTISPVLPGISLEYSHIDNYEFLVKLILTLPALFIAISAPVMGYLADHSGRKPVLLFCIVLYVLAGSSALYLDSLEYILIGRAFLGIAVGGIITITITLLGDYYQGEQLNKYMGLQSGIVGFAGVLFLITGGILADYHWKIPFVVYLIPLLYFVLTTIFINEPDKQRAVQETGNQLTAVKVPFKFLALVYLLAFLAMVVFYITLVQLPFYLKQLGNTSNALTGIIIASGTLVSAFSSLLYKKFKSVFSFQSIFLISFGLMAAGYIYLSFINNYYYCLISMVLIGFSVGLIIPNLSVVLIANVPESIRARAIGGSTCTYFFGEFASPVVMYPLISIFSLKYMFVVIGTIVMVVVCIVCLFKILYKQRIKL